MTFCLCLCQLRSVQIAPNMWQRQQVHVHSWSVGTSQLRKVSELSELSPDQITDTPNYICCVLQDAKLVFKLQVSCAPVKSRQRCNWTTTLFLNRIEPKAFPSPWSTCVCFIF